MKDDLSLGDAQPGAPRPLLRRVRGFSRFCVCCGVRGGRADAGELRQGQSSSRSEPVYDTL